MQKKTLDPVFRGSHRFVIDTATTQDLHIEAWDRDAIKSDDFLAIQVISVARLSEGGDGPSSWPLDVDKRWRGQERHSSENRRVFIF